MIYVCAPIVFQRPRCKAQNLRTTPHNMTKMIDYCLNDDHQKCVKFFLCSCVKHVDTKFLDMIYYFRICRLPLFIYYCIPQYEHIKNLLSDGKWATWSLIRLTATVFLLFVTCLTHTYWMLCYIHIQTHRVRTLDDSFIKERPPNSVTPVQSKLFNVHSVFFVLCRTRQSQKSKMRIL